MAGAADQAFDMNFSGAAASAPASPPVQSNVSSGAADQPFDMNFSSGSGASAPAPNAPASSTGGASSYYASLASDYAQRAKADSAARAAAVPSAQPPPGGGWIGQTWSNFAGNFAAPYKAAQAAFSADAAKLAKDATASPDQMTGQGQLIRPQDRDLANMVGDVAAGVASPFTGAYNAFVAQPLAGALDQLGPQKTLSLGANGKVQSATLTPAQTHAQNEQIINTALMGLGPEGAEGGAPGKFFDAAQAKSITGVVNKVPASVAVDASGRLTDEGLEYAAQANVQPKKLEEAYAAVKRAQQARQQAAAQYPAPQAPDSAAPAPEAAPAPAQPPQPSAAPAGETAPQPQAAAPSEPATAPEPAERPAPVPVEGPSAIWRNGTEEHPVTVAGEPVAAGDGREYVPVQSQVHGGMGFAPADEIEPVSVNTRSGPNGLTAFGENPEDLPQTPQERHAEAQSVGVNLTQGQATRNSALLDAEERLRADVNDPNSAAANQFRTEQQANIANAVDDLKQSISDPTLTAEDRGNLLQAALRQAHANGVAGTSAIYDQLRQLTEALGDRGSNILKLDTGDLTQAVKNVLIDENVDPQARAALRQQAAQYGLIGGPAKEYEDGSAVVRLLDQEGNEGPTVQLPRKPEPLTIQNAEKFRQGLNRIYQAHETPEVLSVKAPLDQAVDDALSRAVNSDEAREIAQTAERARAMHRRVKEAFDGKDIVSDLIAWKREGITPKLNPEQAIDRLFAGGKDSITPIKRVKAVLLSSPTPESRAAMEAIKGRAIEKIFDQARVVNADGGRGAISGAKLQTAIRNFGVDKLKEILSPEEFNQLMKIKRVSVNATVMPDYIVNSSNTANVFQRYFAKHGRNLFTKAVSGVPGAGELIEAAGEYHMEKQAQKASDRTLNGILNYRP